MFCTTSETESEVGGVNRFKTPPQVLCIMLTGTSDLFSLCVHVLVSISVLTVFITSVYLGDICLL